MGVDLGSNGVIEGRLTEAQEGLWLARRLDPRNPSQNTGQILRLRGPIDTESLRGVVQQTIDECDAFRVRIAGDPAAPTVTSRDVPHIRVAVDDVSGERDPERVIRSRVQSDVERPRDPASDPMASSVVYRVADDEHWWYFCGQHLVIDGYGTTLLNVRFMDLLRAVSTGEPPRTPELGSFQAVLEEDAAYRVSADRLADRRFWGEELAELADVASLSGGEPLPSAFHHRARRVIGAELQGALEAMGRDAGVTWPDAVAAAVAAFVARHTGDGDIVLGLPVMNRLGSASARVPCTIMNVTPIRVRLDEAETPGAIVARFGDASKRARAHGRYRSEELRRELGFVGEGRRLFGPLVNVLPFRPLPAVEGVAAHLEVLGAGPVDDVTFTFRGGGVDAGIALEVDSNPALYSLAQTETFRDRLLAFLEAFAAEDHELARVPTLTETEKERWVRGVNDTAHAVEETTLVERLERTVRARPDAVALVGEEIELTYAEVIERTNALARRLRAAGVGRGAIVGVCYPRSVDQVLGFLGVMSAGAAYLPLDPEHPEGRIRQLIGDAEPRVVLAPSSLSRLVPADSVDLVVWPPGSVDESAPSDVEPEAPRPHDAAYVIYTSGSTGRPKGVVIEHRAIVNRLEWMRAAFAFGPDDRILHKTPATFDVSVWELFLPMLCGATLVVAPPTAHRDPAWIARLIREHGITAVHFVPSMLGPFLDHPSADGLEVRRVFCSGEALTAPLRDRFHRRVRGELHNLYGPTEAAVDVTHWAAPPHDTSDPIPIGRPVWNTRMYVLDDHQRPVPPGVVGDLFIAGRQLARGYLGRDDLTSDRFIPDPFVAGERMYRTGDLAAWREDGALEFAGRADHQVKIRGQRIELGEIETVIADLPGVASAAVRAWAEPQGAALVAYATATSGTVLDPDGIRAEVTARLPDAMVPRVVLALDDLPLTSSGKLDRNALPRPPRARAEDTGALTTPTQRLVAEMFRQVLDIDGMPGPTDDFFALGGHSLTAVELLAEVRSRCGVDLGPGALFSRPTVTRFAEAIDRGGPGPEARSDPGLDETYGLEPLLELSSGPEDRAPLYCIHPAGGISWCYGTLARALASRRRVIGLQATGLRTGRPLPGSLTEMASSYVDAISTGRRDRPFHLLGWSVGGIIAHAMAARLLEIGCRVGQVVLLDAYPADCWHDAPPPGPDAALRALLLIAGEDPETIDPDDLTRETVRARLAERGHVLGALSDDALDGVVRVVESNNRLVREHHHEPVEADLIHFQAGLDHVGERFDAGMWAPYARRVEAHVIPFVHARMTGGAASERVATVLGQRLESGRGR
ncbi:MAG: amino acid adenylation domain-containing protein [Gemmatimonadetes bacterium]|nr:amino acid adenylation domain-containing protein [Gemmatimonadota bacterium]